MTRPSSKLPPMTEAGADQMDELIAIEQHQALRLDQIRVMLGVLVGIALAAAVLFIAFVTQ